MAPDDPTPSWPYWLRLITGIAGLALTAGSWFALVVLQGFWKESGSYPNEAVEFAGTWGLILFAVAVGIYWAVRSALGFRLLVWDAALLILPLATVAFYVVPPSVLIGKTDVPNAIECG